MSSTQDQEPRRSVTCCCEGSQWVRENPGTLRRAWPRSAPTEPSCSSSAARSDRMLGSNTLSCACTKTIRCFSYKKQRESCLRLAHQKQTQLQPPVVGQAERRPESFHGRGVACDLHECAKPKTIRRRRHNRSAHRRHSSNATQFIIARKGTKINHGGTLCTGILARKVLRLEYVQRRTHLFQNLASRKTFLLCFTSRVPRLAQWLAVAAHDLASERQCVKGQRSKVAPIRV